MINHKRIPTWDQEIIQDVEKHGATNGSFKEWKIPWPYSSYVALLCDIINVEPSSYVEETDKKVWKNAMIDEY